MALIKLLKVNQSTSFTTDSFYIRGNSAVNSAFSGNFSYSSLLYTVPSGKVAKVIINSIDFNIVNTDFASLPNGGYDPISALNVSYSHSNVQKFLYNIGSTLSFSYYSSNIMAGGSFGVAGIQAGPSYYNFVGFASMLNSGIMYKNFSTYLLALNNSITRGDVTSNILHPLDVISNIVSGASSSNYMYWKAIDFPAIGPITNGSSYIPKAYDSVYYPRVCNLSSGETVAIDFSLSYAISYSRPSNNISNLTNQGVISQRKWLNLVLDCLVIEDNA